MLNQIINNFNMDTDAQVFFGAGPRKRAAGLARAMSLQEGETGQERQEEHHKNQGGHSKFFLLII